MHPIAQAIYHSLWDIIGAMTAAMIGVGFFVTFMCNIKRILTTPSEAVPYTLRNFIRTRSLGSIWQLGVGIAISMFCLGIVYGVNPNAFGFKCTKATHHGYWCEMH